MPKSSTAIEMGDENAARRVVIIHGYTGSPDEFAETARVLAARLEAQVSVPLLPGHGTQVEDLLSYTLDDLIAYTRTHIEKVAASGKPLLLIGHSLGANLALLAGRNISPSAFVLTVMPYLLRPPFSIPGMDLYARRKKLWDKPISDTERSQRAHLFFYEKMPGIALGILKEANRRVHEIRPHIPCPILTIQNTEDPTCYPESGSELLAEIGHHPASKSIVLERKEHGLFYGPDHELVIEHIAQFLENALTMRTT